MPKTFVKILVTLSSLLLLSGCLSSDESADRSLANSIGENDSVIVDEFNVIIDAIPEEEDDAETIIEGNVIIDEDPVEPPVIVEEEPAEPPVIVEEEEETPEEVIVDNPPNQCVKQKYYSVKMLDGTNSPASKVRAYNSSLPAKVNYNYYSWSSHTIVGAQPKEFEGNFYIYEGSDGVSFNFIYNVDAGGSPDNKVRMDVIVTGNDGVDRVLISDDSAEVKRSTASNGETTYQAKLHYWSNTDGGSIGPFVNNNFKARVKIYYVGDNKEVVFHSADGGIVPLELAQSTPNLFSEFEVTFSEEVESCSAEADKLIARNQCIDEQYQAHKDDIEDADWVQKYRDQLAERRAQILALREVHKAALKEFRASFDERIAAAANSTERKAIYAERRSSLKSMSIKLREERRTLANRLLINARVGRSDAIAKQDRVHHVFESSLNACFE